MTNIVVEAIAREFDGAGRWAPASIAGSIAGRVAEQDYGPVDIADIVNVMIDERVVTVRSYVVSAFVLWDNETAAEWTRGTEPNSASRRELIYRCLGIPSPAHEAITTQFPLAGGPVVIAAPQPWTPWYTLERRAGHDFYWQAYRRVLEVKGWSVETISALDSATTQVVQRLADPSREEPYRSKGLVVGYVQSGKTANFTGVLAKAIDAGYRLIIVLTGTIELLRSQTQRRLDMELIGVQNIDEDEYANDEGWLDGAFVTHVDDPNRSNTVPAVRRLTGAADDYRSLGKGIGALHYEFADHDRPLFDPVNLYASNVRIAVLKKNSMVLKKLVDDLRKVSGTVDLAQIPALIVDDEADQASVNTEDPNKFAEGKIERTAINRQISHLLELLDRCQYVGYTATPFANVFVDPDDADTIFPNDFIISLDRPENYMGGADFHDLEDDLGDGVDKTPANSNERAFVRSLRADCDEDRDRERLTALDSFVIAGAIKLFRQDRGVAGDYRHHTMLVHESFKKDDHRSIADDIESLWKSAGYSQPEGLRRLRELWENDFRIVSHARADSDAVNPAVFDDLELYIGQACDRINDGVSPVIVVNGDADKLYLQEPLDFQEHPVWKILVGGTKLSRGFTVEGLTITYYTRRTLQADTMMQMGRWFGFRPGYRDLVRLFIGRDVPGPGGATFDLYEAFGAIIKDEEDFRDELARFNGSNAAGEPLVIPRDVPPMVFQRLPWLRPTAKNKMFNAELAYRSVGGQSFSFTMQPPREDGINVRHFAAVRPLLDALTDEDTFTFVDKDGAIREFRARYGIVSARGVFDAVNEFVWDPHWDFGPHRLAFDTAMNDGLLDDFAVLLPIPKKKDPVLVGDYPTLIPIVNRKREQMEYRTGFTGTAVRERDAIEHIAGNPENLNGGERARKLRKPTRGGMILVFASDPADRHRRDVPTGRVHAYDVATLFTYALPYAACPNPRIGFTVRKSDAGAIVDAE